MKSSLRLASILLLGLFALTSCGQGETETGNEIRLQARAVGGGPVLYDDLASEDTVLWFWAPW